MKKNLILITLLIASVSFIYFKVKKSDSEENDLKIIVKKSYLSNETKPLLISAAAKTLNTNSKVMSEQDLMKKFDEALKNEENLVKFFQVYKEKFTRQEIREMRKLLEKPIFKKYSKESLALFQANQILVQEILREIIENEGKERDHLGF